ncbi:DUF4870 domain-containing protein [Homoserinimonas sp. OAct 916]|uniref:DUF4870 domain-containing protein n=1 Tax=Homoserinimonas sp. OAct 916 TaxID=2211450 RepID=UPI000DBE5D7F|nr:DUF4870 domain-containing protein [Homoserinimonas sp. OAct 916]
MTDHTAQPPHEPPAGQPAQPGQPVPPQQGQQVPPVQGQPVPPQQGQQAPPQQPYQQQPYQQQPAQPGQPYPPQPGYPQQGQPAAGAVPLSPADDKQWAMFAHFGGILWILPSLIIYLVFKDRGALTRQESKEALNWQITFIGSYIILWIIVAILSAILIFSGGWVIVNILGWLPWLLYIANVVFSIMGGVKVNQGGAYRYPVSLRLIK